MAEPVIPARIALDWADDLARRRPAAPTEAEAATSIPVMSFNFAGARDGMYLRLATSQGQVLFFLNAPVAIQLADAIRRTGTAAVWMNEDDGSLIVRDPQNAGHAGPKS